MVDLTAPLLVLQRRMISREYVGVTAVTAYGRTVNAVVPFWGSTDEEIDRALRQSWALQVEADETRCCVLQSLELDMRDGYALDDPDTDTTTG